MANANLLEGRSERGRRVLNPRALAIILGVSLIVVPGVRRLHGHQFEKTRQFLRNRAMDAVQKGDVSAANLMLSQYLTMRPSDVEAREQLSLLLIEKVGTADALERAFRLNEDLLRNNIPQNELRLRQAKLAVRTHRYSDAEAHLKILQSAMPDSSEVWHLSGIVAGAMRHSDTAEKYFRRSIESPQAVPESFSSLAELLETEKASAEEVSELYAKMVEQCNPEDGRRLRAAWYMKNKKYREAISDLQVALEMAPKSQNLNAMLVTCVRQLIPGVEYGEKPVSQDPQTEQSLRHFASIVSTLNEEPLQRINFAVLLWHVGKHNDALELLQEGIQSHPSEFRLHTTLADYLVNAHRPEEARLVCQSVPADAASRSVLVYLQGRILMEEEKWQEAVTELERCIAFSGDDSDTLSRAQMAVAIARRHIDSGGLAEDAYRTVLLQAPDSVSGRLGMAASWAASGKTELAIAEYRQLLSVDGVPAYLASLMIQHNLTLPESVRDWNYIETLIRDDQPLINDGVQRTLLRADLLFAQGNITAAFETIESGSRKYPERPELSRALRRFNGELSVEIEQRLAHVIHQEPMNVAAHTMLIRSLLVSGDQKSAETRLNEIAEGRTCPELSRVESLCLAAETAQLIEVQERIKGTSAPDWLQPVRIRILERLVGEKPEELSVLVGSLSSVGRSSDALHWIQTAIPGATLQNRAQACLQLAKCSQNRRQDVASACTVMMNLIRQYPTDLTLRLLYAEILLCSEEYQKSEETLRQILAADPGASEAKSRLAWILAVGETVSETQRNESLRLAEEAISEPGAHGSIRGLCARVQFEAGQFEAAKRILGPSESVRSDESSVLVCRAAILMAMRKTEEARTFADAAGAASQTVPLLPADQRLLDRVIRDLKPAETAAR
jgi:tetratricopeptide (TPR) repeat protein